MSIYYEGYRDYLRNTYCNPYDGPDSERYKFGWQTAQVDVLEDSELTDRFYLDPREQGYDDFFDYKPLNRWSLDTIQGQDWLVGWEQARWNAAEWSSDNHIECEHIREWLT